MQLLLSKSASHSKATENLVKGLPVKERETPLQTQPITCKKIQLIKHVLDSARLDLEIGTYWALSKYQQTIHKKYQY